MIVSNSSFGKLLVIDHEPDVSQEIKRYLEQGHYDVQFALEGDQAISVIHTSRPDLILLASNLPGRSGIEICRLIKSETGLGFLPVLLITSADPNDLVMGFEAGADDFLSKPIRELELLT